MLRFAGLEIDRERQAVTIEGNDPQLTNMEYRLLVLLAESPRKPFSRDEILNALKGDGFEDRVVEAFNRAYNQGLIRPETSEAPEDQQALEETEEQDVLSTVPA